MAKIYMDEKMRITKLDQSGFLVEKVGRGLVIDPVEFDHKLPSMVNLDAIVITHLHGDHFQPEVLKKLMAENPGTEIFTTADNVENIEGAKVAKDGDRVRVGKFDLEFYGGEHAEIVKGQVPCENIGVLVDGYFASSGDAFDLPPNRPAVLAAPISAPWLKLSETMDFIEKSGAKIVVSAHDALNSEFGNEVCDNWIEKCCEEVGAEYRNVHFGEVERS